MPDRQVGIRLFVVFFRDWLPHLQRIPTSRHLHGSLQLRAFQKAKTTFFKHHFVVM